MKSFSEKYTPKLSSEIPQPVEQLKVLIKNKRHSLLYGPTGSCKTSSVYTIADEFDYELVEVNASDFRTKEQIESILVYTCQQKSLFQKEKIILIDEIDCLSGMDDRGGAQAIVNLLKISKFPIVLTANDLHNEKIKDIKKLTNNIEFKPINSKDVSEILKKICENEKIRFTEQSLREIIINANGDLRAAINELQANIINNELISRKEPREYNLDIMHILNTIFKTKDFNNYRIMENTSVDLDEYLLWLDENLPLEYKDNEDIYNSYDLLSKADVFKGRIRKWQYWRFMFYQSLFCSSGISVIKKIPNNITINYKRSMRPLKIWQVNMKISKKKAISAKFAKLTHTSKNYAFKNFNNFKHLIKNENIIKELDLDEEEIIYIKNG
ncbi:replication factor C large subunit [Candidatus Woesearchaeota archaeon]|nr:replication factor C large subunit [Candidatus Woesearchaeota archaeon]